MNKNDYNLEQYEWFTKQWRGEPDEQNCIAVYGFKEYGPSSVLAGQYAKCLIEWFDSEEEVDELFPDAEWGSKWTDPQVSVSHLPDHGDLY